MQMKSQHQTQRERCKKKIWLWVVPLSEYGTGSQIANTHRVLSQKVTSRLMLIIILILQTENEDWR